MIKKIISKTVLFISIVLFVVVFKAIFGEVNTYVGITTLVLALCLMQRNLMVTPVQTLIKLIIINLILGLGAFIVNQNIWVGLVVNFIILFLIAYLFSYEVRKSLSMMVGLHYILMIAAGPVGVAELPSRIAALIVGPFIIMALQVVINQNKLQKSAMNILPKIEKNILGKINLLRANKETEELNGLIEDDIKNMKIIIHDSVKKNTYMSEYGKAIIAVLSSLERINILLDKMINTNYSRKSLDKVLFYLKDISENNLKEISLDSMENNCDKCSMDNIIEYEFVATIKTFSYEKKQLKDLDEQKAYEWTNDEQISEIYKESNIIKRTFKLNNIRVGYGIRLGLLVAATKFATDYFNLEFGNWMIYTVFALTQPYAEYTITKSRKRAVGTVVGSIVIFVLFNLITDVNVRTALVLLIGYLMSYAVDYRNVITFVTLSSVASAALNSASPNLYIINRLLYVAIGIAIALIANRLVFRGSYKDEEVGILNLQRQVSDFMFKEVFVNKDHATSDVNNLFLFPSFIEDRIKTSNLDIEKGSIYNKRVLINDIHQVYLIGNENKEYRKAMEKIYDITNNCTSKETAEEKLKDILKGSNAVKEKVLAAKTLKIINQLDSIYNT